MQRTATATIVVVKRTSAVAVAATERLYVMPPEPISLRVLADFASEAIHLDLLKPAQVVVWADLLIAECQMPPVWMIDLALVDPLDPHAVIMALRGVPGESHSDHTIALLNGLVFREWQRGNLTIGQVRGIGWTLFRKEFEERDLTQWGVVVECNGEYLDEGYLSEDDMRDLIDGELAKFEEESQRLPQWA